MDTGEVCFSADSSGIAAFRRAYFGPIDQFLAWHDGYEADTACLAALTPAEQGQAEAELLTALRQRRADARAMLGLGYLRSEEALPLLHYCLRQDQYAYYALLAIAQITPAGLHQHLIVEILTLPSSSSHLTDVLLGLAEAFALSQVGAAVASAVWHLFAHPDYLVRYHALSTLRRFYSVPDASHTAAAVRGDTLFGLICEKRAPRAYRRAQQLFVEQLPTATRQLFPLS